MEKEVEQVLVRLGELQAETQQLQAWLVVRADQEHRAAHGDLYDEMSEQLHRLSVARTEAHLAAGAGRGGYANPNLLSADQVEERKKRILAETGFSV